MVALTSRLKELRKKNNYEIKDIVAFLECSVSHYRKLESGTRRLNMDHLSKLAELYNCSVGYISGDDIIKPPSKANVIDKNGATLLPVYESIPAGIPVQGVQENDEFMLFDSRIAKNEGREIDDYFFLKVKDNSMEPNLCAGDIALIKKQTAVEDGKIAVVICRREEAVCKRVITTANKIIVISDNAVFSPIAFEFLECHIIGKVISHTRNDK